MLLLYLWIYFLLCITTDYLYLVFCGAEIEDVPWLSPDSSHHCMYPGASCSSPPHHYSAQHLGSRDVVIL